MIELWIDDKRCDVEKLPAIPIDFDIENLTKVEGERSGRTIELELPATPANNLILGPSRDLYAAARFNMEHHTAKLKRDGVEIFGGTVYLISTTIYGGSGEGYTIRIREGGAEWIESVVYGKLSNLDIQFSASYTLSSIEESWEGESAVRFLPVWRGGQVFGYSPFAIPIEHVMLTDDYHPFISISAMVRAMFEKSGYTLHSNFFDSDLGQSLYMSGDYMRGDVSAAKSKCNFFARRIAPITATADSMGRVYATTSMATHTVGPIVDNADPEVFDSNGVQMTECFNTYSAFRKGSGGNISFVPKSSVKVGFILHLEYSTDYKVISRDKFAGFNIVEGLNGVNVEFSLANTFRDLRNELSTNWQYRAIVFDHTERREYHLVGELENGDLHTMGQWSSRSALVTTSTTAPIAAHLYYRDSSSASWSRYQGDWALYAGYLGEEGSLDVVMDIRFPPKEVAAGEELLLDKFWFGGAEKGMSITIGNGTTLRPYFTAVPGYGSILKFKDVAPDIRQSDLLSALGDMFNLAFYTDRERKVVHIEPLESLYDDSKVVDISDFVDLSHGIEIVDCGIDAPQLHKLVYKSGDGASDKFNTENKTTLGKWSYRNPLYGTINSQTVIGDKLFTTTVNTTNVVSCAPSASLMQMGDMSDQGDSMESALLPHIVCYKGLRPLPEGECWIVGEKLPHYPYAAFIDDEEINLCFESRNGIDGLHTYHLPKLLRQTEGQRVTLNLCPTIVETASILTENGPKPSVRTSFRLKIQGESSLFRIVKIENWDTDSGSVRCTFERILKD